MPQSTAAPEFAPLPLDGPLPPLPPLPPSNSRRLTGSSPLKPIHGAARRSFNDNSSRESSLGSSESSGGLAPATSQRAPLQPRTSSSSRIDLDAGSVGVLSGAVGGNFGPFPRSSANFPPGQAPYNYRDSIASSDVAIDLGQDYGSPPVLAYRDSASSGLDSPGFEGIRRSSSSKPEINTALLWDKTNVETDDYLHDPNPELDRKLDQEWGRFSTRGFFNVALLVLIVGALVGMFMGWPVWVYLSHGGFSSLGSGGSNFLGWNIGGINGSGQVPEIGGLPGLIDISTPQEAYTRTGFDGARYKLVFSDEFNTDGRSFNAGDDPWWEAVDLWYHATKDLEWYDPAAVTTTGGKLKITLSEEPINDLNFRSGMISSWNKLCFTGGYIEVSISLPGTPLAQGFWPAVWTMGNLARAGYSASADGMWPYSYDSCDVGTMPNQTMPDGTPVAAHSSGSTDYGGELSWLPGQRASACTCKGEDHPGPRNSVGRGAPEIDIIEGQVDYRLLGSASQSIQMAPMDAGYAWLNDTPAIRIWNETGTFQNDWHGAVYQESMSVITLLDTVSYEDAQYQTFGYEYDPGADGRITWAVGGKPTWEMTAAAIGPNAATQISQRLISEEPMAININLAISTAFQTPEWGKLTFPAHFYVDYVRVYQKGEPNVGCNPASHPTTDYIERHMDVYTNPNLTSWITTPGKTMPKNSLAPGGC